MYETLFETNSYEWITLYKSKYITVRYVRYKYNNKFDKIRIVKKSQDNDKMVYVFRYEDEKLFDVLLNTFKEME